MRRGLLRGMSLTLCLILCAGFSALAESPEPEVSEQEEFALTQAETAVAAPESAEAARGENAGKTPVCDHLNADYKVEYKPWYSIGTAGHRADTDVSSQLYCPDCGQWVSVQDVNAEALYAAYAKDMATMAALYEQVQYVPDSRLTYEEQEARRVMNRMVRAYELGPASFADRLYTESRNAAFTASKTEPHSFNADGVCVCGAKLSEIGHIVSGNEKLKINLGETLQIGLKGATPKGWKAKNSKIVKLSKDGRITALKEGKTTVTITLTNKRKWKLTVTVIDPRKPAGIGINALSPMGMKVGDVVRLTTWVKPATAQTTYTWKSSKPKVVSVSADGTLVAKKAGSAKITVKTGNGKKATIKVRVKK
ncbi:MAG: Ig domain-containing protein [Clostridia bacterium]|nr:Ig domain-containing protein [Clostridia bacterium]